MWWPIRSRTSTRGIRPPSTGTRPSPFGTISGPSALASPRRWTPRSAAWASTGRSRSNSSNAAPPPPNAPRSPLLPAAPARITSPPRRPTRSTTSSAPIYTNAKPLKPLAAASSSWPAAPSQPSPATPTTTPPSMPAFSTRSASPSSSTGSATCSIPRSKATGVHPRSLSHAELPRHHSREHEENRRHQNLPPRRRPGSLDAPTAASPTSACIPATILTTTASSSATPTPLRRPARHLRRHRSCRIPRSHRARCRRHRALPSTPRAHRTALPPHLRCAYAAYKTGVVFLAYLNGLQSHFRMVGGAENARSVAHICRTFPLADRRTCFATPTPPPPHARTSSPLAGIA